MWPLVLVLIWSKKNASKISEIELIYHGQIEWRGEQTYETTVDGGRKLLFFPMIKPDIWFEFAVRHPSQLPSFASAARMQYNTIVRQR